MSVLAWCLVPIVVTLIAIAFVTWRGRPGPPEDTHEAMEARERFRRAIEGGTGPSRKPTRTPSARAKGDEGDDAADQS
jgi:hypothetical protein